MAHALDANRQYIPITPFRRQMAFLIAPHEEALYGGSAAGGKSIALLAAALLYVHLPGYAALVLRRTFRDLSQPDALIPLSKAWLMKTDATWSAQDKRWTFPSGATLTFGYCESEDDVYQYQGAAYQTCCFDELTQFTEFQYTYLFSRLRRVQSLKVPLRMRAASNPGGVGHQWVRSRFVVSSDPARLFVPAKLADNTHIDGVAYGRSLAHLDPVRRQQLRDGNWDVRAENGVFDAQSLEWLCQGVLKGVDGMVANVV